MSDLVRELREHAYRVAGDGPGGPDYDPETLGLELSAADEIERLREALRELCNCGLTGPLIDKARVLLAQEKPYE